MSLFEQYGFDLGYVLIGNIVATILLLIIIIVIMAKHSKLKKTYNKFMSGSNGESLESEVMGRFTDIEKIKSQIETMDGRLKVIDDTLLSTYQKVGIIKYDAFKEMGGKLSFAIALLNETNDGFILNSMHSSREGCYTYIKEIIKGESFIMLAEEEKEALDLAIKSRNFME